MVDAQSGVARISISEIVPERGDALARMKGPQRIGSTLRDEPGKRFLDLGGKQRVVDPSLGLINVEFGRHHTIVAEGRGLNHALHSGSIAIYQYDRGPFGTPDRSENSR
jgi:hypothetical protein